MIQIRHFTGAFPATPAQLLPDNAAQYAKDCDVVNGELSGVFSAQNVFPELPVGTKGVFTPDGHHIITSSSPMRAHSAPTVDDVHDRVYFTNDDGLRVCRWTDAGPTGATIDSWKVGVPAPLTAISLEKKRKTRWPNYPEAAIKARFYRESAGLRYGETDVTLTPKVGAIPFSAYTFDSGINVSAVDAAAAAAAAESSTSLRNGDSVQALAIYCNSYVSWTHPDATSGEFNAGWNYFLFGSAVVTVGASSLSVAVPYISTGGISTTYDVTLSAAQCTLVRLTTSAEVSVDYAAAPVGSPTATPEGSSVCVEVWLENTANPGERIWTVYTGSSMSAGTVSSFPGGAEVTLTATGDTTYEINISYGVVEDRAYVYTMVNDWNEESQPSAPAVVSVTFVDDVLLKVDYSSCAVQLDGYRALDHLQFYCAAENGKYIAINSAPAAATTVTDLYHTLFWREPDAEGLAFWTAQEQSGISIADISASMQLAAERFNYENYLITEDLYVELLGHPSDEPGFNYWRNKLEAGEQLISVIWSFLNSANSFVTHPVPAQINWYYQTFMERDADAAGLAYWTEKTAADPHELANMLYIMLKSKEYAELNKVRHITQILNIMFDREPTAPEIAAAVAKYESGQDYNAIATTTHTVDGFVDEGTNRTKGLTLPTLNWTCPPADLKMLTMLSNGVMAGVRDNYVYFSEPYMPHAWPLIYGQAVPFNVVGAMAYEGQLLITTTSSPFVISGTHPGGMTQQRIGSGEACVNEHAMTVVAGRPVYASRDGIVTLNGTSGSLDLSHKFWSSKTWRSIYGDRIADIRLMAHDNKLIALFGSGDGFIINLGGDQPHLVEYSQTSGYPFTVPGEESLHLATGKTPASEYTHYENYLITEDLYIELLGHASDKTGFNYWRNKLEAGEQLVDVIWAFIVSANVLASHPVPANINWYYQAFMGRDADAPGLAYWTAAINKDQKQLAHMLYAMLTSTEYADLNKTRHVKQVIEIDLGRAATAPEIAAGVALYDADNSYATIAAISDTGSANKKLFFGSRKDFLWKSKEYTMPQPTTFSAVKVVSTGDAVLSFYGDGVRFHVASVSSTERKDHYLRLPGTTRYSRFNVQIEGAATIIELHIANSMGELARG